MSKKACLDLGRQLIEREVSDYGLIYSINGDIDWHSNNRTWFIGALRRALIALEEQERIDQQSRQQDA